MCVCGRERTVPSVRIVRKLTRVSNDIVQPFPEVTNILAAFVLPLHAPLERRRITRPRSHRDPFRGAQGSQKTSTRDQPGCAVATRAHLSRDHRSQSQVHSSKCTQVIVFWNVLEPLINLITSEHMCL